jgi:hypothetical protein
MPKVLIYHWKRIVNDGAVTRQQPPRRQFASEDEGRQVLPQVAPLACRNDDGPSSPDEIAAVQIARVLVEKRQVIRRVSRSTDHAELRIARLDDVGAIRETEHARGRPASGNRWKSTDVIRMAVGHENASKRSAGQRGRHCVEVRRVADTGIYQRRNAAG